MTPDYLVVGAGVAGLRAAIELAQAGEVLILTKDSLHESSSEYAQGGIAAALSDDDEVELHEHDTLAAGDGLCNPQAVHVLVEEAPAAIQELIEWGAAFDREGSRLLFAREGAHSRSRVLHANGDSTGHEIARTLYEKAATIPNVHFRSYAAITDLLLRDGKVTGAQVFDEAAGRLFPIEARAVLLATGGMGRVFKETTNPDVATGDGVATAYRAGAEISDIEFVQFHPTALHVRGAPRFLLSEALRGEGAYLRNQTDERFMTRYHPMVELAPRDVVSRAIVSEMEHEGAPHVFLDLRHLDRDHIRHRFPRIFETCRRYGVDIARDLVPVHPAAHYAMGGVRTDLEGRTSLPRLYAAGEAACTGVHGANRLASNSLLEGVVFGARAGRAMLECSKLPFTEGSSFAARTAEAEMRFPAISEQELRSLAWRDCGILRSGTALEKALQMLEALPLVRCPEAKRGHYELRNIHVVCSLIARCALAREESRGGHYRSDFPEKRPEFQKHSVVSLQQHVRWE
ncbi:MAG TPA: L-aspartate oxidase [Bryobacteraceae bacterium]|nr:L-aspartate oxidase [Bryobacteraceae bacterium]